MDCDAEDAEQRVSANHPIRLIKALAEVALNELVPLLEQMYREAGRNHRIGC